MTVAAASPMTPSATLTFPATLPKAMCRIAPAAHPFVEPPNRRSRGVI
jgi:hypothetical protein